MPRNGQDIPATDIGGPLIELKQAKAWQQVGAAQQTGIQRLSEAGAAVFLRVQGTSQGTADRQARWAGWVLPCQRTEDTWW